MDALTGSFISRKDVSLVDWAPSERKRLFRPSCLGWGQNRTRRGVAPRQCPFFLACKAWGKTVSSNQDSLVCAVKADSCDDGSEFQDVDVFLGDGLGLCLARGGNPGKSPSPSLAWALVR